MLKHIRDWWQGHHQPMTLDTTGGVPVIDGGYRKRPRIVLAVQAIATFCRNHPTLAATIAGIVASLLLALAFA